MATMCNGGGKFVEKGSFVKKGTTIIEAEPFAVVLSSKFRTERCDVCFKRCKISRCSGCQYVYYCSRNCQRNSWAVHKIECSNMKRIYPRILPEAARMMSRIIIKMKNGGSEERGYYSSNEYRTFDDLMSHCCNIKQDLKKMEHFTSLCAVLYEFLPHTYLPKMSELLEIFGRISINSFHVLDLEMASIGVGIYLGPSVIDHSCKPNAVTVFDGTTLIVRSLRDIPSFDWTKVSITYIDALRCVDERREELQSSYYFCCDCDGCTNPVVAATAAACPNKNCHNPCFPRDLKCGKCGREFPKDFDETFETTEALTLRHLDKMKKMKNDNPPLDVCRMCLKEQDGVLHPLNMLHVRTLEMASLAATESELWEEAEIYATKLTQKYEYYYGDSHPITGHMYLTLGKVFGFGQKPKKAFDVIRKALDIIKLAFGENHSKMKEVKQVADWIIVEYKRSCDL